MTAQELAACNLIFGFGERKADLSKMPGRNFRVTFGVGGQKSEPVFGTVLSLSLVDGLALATTVGDFRCVSNIWQRVLPGGELGVVATFKFKGIKSPTSS
jgi:hypothetical protein